MKVDGLLIVLSLDSNTSGLHVNLLAGWTYIGGAGQDSMIGCSISVVSISPVPSLRTWISLDFCSVPANQFSTKLSRAKHDSIKLSSAKHDRC